MFQTVKRKSHPSAWSSLVSRWALGIVLFFFSNLAQAQEALVSFKTWQGNYLVAENGGGGAVNANRTTIGTWEKFVIEQYPLMDGDKIHLRTSGGRYLSSESSGNLLANKTAAGSWETFTLVNHSNPRGRLRANDTVSLRSVHNQYVVAEEDGTASANRSSIGAWEKFVVIAHRLPEISGLSNDALNAIEARKAQFRKATLSNAPSGVYPLPILAYEGVPLKTADIDEAVRQVLNMETGDFRLATLVRVLYLTPNYDQQILPSLRNLNYWLTPGENLYCYWSENHMILWMSSAYLMKQREGWPMDPDLEKRLLNYLNVKLKYGFYEFFSTTYQPFTLAALLNLTDFANDATIKTNGSWSDAHQQRLCGSLFVHEQPRPARRCRDMEIVGQHDLYLWSLANRSQDHPRESDSGGPNDLSVELWGIFSPRCGGRHDLPRRRL